MGSLTSDVNTLLDYKKSKKDAESSRQKVLAQISEDEKNKTNLVKKALATQRAQYGAGGMTGKSMTEEAVLKRLREETEEPFNEKKRLNLEKIRSIKPNKHNLLKYGIKKLGQIMDSIAAATQNYKG